jgi:uncharacterized membrane protein YeaQ/YmgE (transglycosylase-associated protein family)
MHILAILLVGFMVGALAKWIFPGRAPKGLLLTSLLGVSGAVLAALIGHLGGWYAPHEHAGLIASVAGAIGMLALYRHYVPARSQQDRALDE